jgi:hypothetical protein|uniref:Uncharacterized protein n=1 Tax=viral metagenome TaxID=1070528 RepID=A0A6C0BG69_9ZZZZ
MKFNQLTYHISIVILVITALYTLVYAGLTGLLLTSAVTLLAAAFIDEFEIVAAITIIFALFYTMYLKRYLQRLEPFTDKEILKRVKDMEMQYQPQKQNINTETSQPAGCYNPSIEGFATLSDTSEGKPNESGPASAKTTDAIPSPEVDKVTKAVSAQENTTKKDMSSKDIPKEEFKSATGGLFKLGEMPSEHKDGPHLDAGKTIMQAMSNFDPKTISSMTDDTKKLLETQKGLMSMLNQMRPVLADGRELLQTFSGMFGGNSSGGASLFNKP